MKVELRETICIIKRTLGDPKFKDGGWGSAESRLLYHVKKILNGQGHDFIKKRIQKDGHMMGDEIMQYLRSRNVRKDPVIAIYDDNYAIRNSAQEFNKYGHVIFRVENIGILKVSSKGMRQTYPNEHK